MYIEEWKDEQRHTHTHTKTDTDTDRHTDKQIFASTAQHPLADTMCVGGCT